jgi:hypothetical protein
LHQGKFHAKDTLTASSVTFAGIQDIEVFIVEMVYGRLRLCLSPNMHTDQIFSKMIKMHDQADQRDKHNAGDLYAGNGKR